MRQTDGYRGRPNKPMPRPRSKPEPQPVANGKTGAPPVMNGLRGLAANLEKEGEWAELLACTDEALALGPEKGDLLEWKARQAWCLFVTDSPERAREVAAEAVGLSAHFTAAPEAAIRALLVSGYLADIRGDHSASVAWYSRALEFARSDGKRAHIFLELGTALSKEGRYAEARDYLRKAAEMKVDAKEGTPILHIRAEAYSRWAVVEEVLGDSALAIALQEKAIEIATSEPAANEDALFAAYRRLSRHHIQQKNWAAASVALESAARFGTSARRGQLFLEHDRARLALAEGKHAEALAGYRRVLGFLPNSAELVLNAHADLWKEVLSGLIQSLREVGDEAGALLAERALQAARDLTMPGIYDAQIGARDQRLGAAKSAGSALWNHLASPTLLHTRSYAVDVNNRVARRRSDGAIISLPSPDCIWPVLQCLCRNTDKRLTSNQLAAHISVSGTHVSAEAVRTAIEDLRTTLGLGEQELVTSRRGQRGGYSLDRAALDDRSTST